MSDIVVVVLKVSDSIDIFFFSFLFWWRHGVISGWLVGKGAFSSLSVYQSGTNGWMDDWIYDPEALFFPPIFLL